jgi:hypothetical protein
LRGEADTGEDGAEECDLVHVRSARYDAADAANRQSDDHEGLAAPKVGAEREERSEDGLADLRVSLQVSVVTLQSG